MARAYTFGAPRGTNDRVKQVPGSVTDKLGEVFGEARVSTRLADLDASARDCWPRGLIAGLPDPGSRPLAVVWPEHVEEVSALVELARREGFALAPLGAGSGVCGGFWPDPRTVVVDLKRLTSFEVSEDGAEVRAGAGLLGWDLEQRLEKLGRTAGHFPSSILCSTVGGWAAARGAGQCSGRYGKIEDMVTELECVLGSGRHLVMRSRSGDVDLVPWLVGSEGTLGIITRVGLRLFPAPAERAMVAFSFPTFEDGQEALRVIYQGGLRPAVARLYDAVDSVLHTSKGSEDLPGEPEPRGGSWLPSLDTLEALALRSVLKAPGQLARLVSLLERQGRARSRLLLSFENVSDPAGQAQLATRWCEELGGEPLGEGPVRSWYEHRYDVSFRQSKVFRAGAFSDTMEVAAPWSKLADVYREVRAAIGDRVLLMAHVSHCYPDGAAIYFTFVGHGRSPERALLRYDSVWADALSAAVSAGACVSHHHGVGRSKAGTLAEQESGAVRDLLGRAWDPEGVLNPGTLGFRGEPATPVGRAPLPGGEAAPHERPLIQVDRVSQLVDVDAGLTLDELENLLFKQGLTLGAEGSGELRLRDWVAAGLPGLPSRWDDPVARPIAGLRGTLASGARCELSAAPRRAEGPDAAACFTGTGGALGHLERVVLAVARRGVQVDPTPGVRPMATAPSPDERAAFDEVRRASLPARARW